MDEREARVIETELRRSLVTLDQIPVPTLSSLRSARPGPAARGLRAVSALAVVAFAVVVALVIADRLTAFRGERAAGPSAPVALDDRYGFLVPDASASRLTLTDEHGHALAGPLDDVAFTRTSPNGRYVAVWQNAPLGPELRIVDGATRTVSAPLLSVQDPATSAGLAWASDDSGVVVTTGPQLAGGGVARVNVWLVTITGASRQIATYEGGGVRPLFWNRPGGLIGLTATATRTGNLMRYVQMRDDGTIVRDDNVSEQPISADGSGSLLVTNANCSPAPCRKYVIRNAATYDTVAEIPVPSTTNVSGLWFRPRSSDLLVLFGTQGTGGSIDGRLVLYPNKGRGAPRDLDSISERGAVGSSFWVSMRADGSAVFFGLTQGESVFQGDLIAIDTGGRTSVQVGRPVATISLSP